MTAAVLQANRQAGMSRLIELVEERAPDGFTNLNDVVSQQELAEAAENYKRVAGFTVQTLTNRSSLSVH